MWLPSCVGTKSNFVKRRATFANPRDMRFTIRELTTGWRRHALAILALGSFLTFLGPFQSQQSMTPGPRTIFWLSLVATGYLLALAAFRLVSGKPANPVVRALAVAAISSLPQMFIVSWALVQIRPGRMIALVNLPMLFLSVLSVQVLIVAIQLWIASLVRNSAGSEAAEPGQMPRSRFAELLPGDIVALEAEDHYVRVHRPSGSTLILHRFSDAVADLGPREGLQVHRGWWVARDAVAGTFLRNGKRWLKLRNDLEIPVSRPHLRRVVDQGWPRIDAAGARVS